MQMAHDNARKLIHFKIDGALDSQEESMLSAHLRGCASCSAYARDIQAIEKILPSLKENYWAPQSIPLPMDTLYIQRQKRSRISTILLATRKLAISLIVVALVFNVWQMMWSGTPSPMPGDVPLIPTPSMQWTSTKKSYQDCTFAPYVVKQNDTLTRIAEQFASSEAEIMELNQMDHTGVKIGRKLLIPVCPSTPTGTVHPTLFTTTYTPLPQPTNSTPGTANSY